MTRYWIGVASREHVQRGVAGGFAQVCHGKPGPLKRMSGGDWITYYSPTVTFGVKDPCRSFTAIGEVTSAEPYTFCMSEDFVPWRRDIRFVAAREAPIYPLLEHLNFIEDKKKWGFPFRRGCFEISLRDFQLIERAMEVA